MYLLENHELPLISGFALVRTGNLFDPKDKIGLAELTGTVMRSGGTKSKTGEQLDEQLENIAASVETGHRRIERACRLQRLERKHGSGAGGLPGRPDESRVPSGQTGSGEIAGS